MRCLVTPLTSLAGGRRDRLRHFLLARDSWILSLLPRAAVWLAGIINSGTKPSRVVL
jgi:hypothetical protein